MIDANRFEDSIEALLSEGLDAADGDLVLVNPPPDCLEALLAVVGTGPERARVRLLADERPLKELVDDFLLASDLADLVESGHLSIRTLEAVPHGALLVSPASVVSLVTGVDGAAGLTATDPEFVEATYDRFDRRWESAHPFQLRTPPRSTVLETLETDIGPASAADFEAVLEAVPAARSDGEGLDEVTISLLVAARNGELLYDISKWGEDVGLASKATFSRTKTRLEEAGLLETEKVPIDVGRPRLRLLLGDDRLETASAAEFADAARRLVD